MENNEIGYRAYFIWPNYTQTSQFCSSQREALELCDSRGGGYVVSVWQRSPEYFLITNKANLWKQTKKTNN